MKKFIVIFIFNLFLFDILIFSQIIVKNKIDLSKKLDAKEVILNKELELGGGKGSNYQFERIRSFRVDEEGNIYVIDTRARKLLKFNEGGSLLWARGKHGQGPGEFQSLLVIEKGIDNFLMVYDLGNRRISYWSRNGKLINEINTANYVRLYRIDDDSKGNFYGILYTYFPEKKIEIEHLYKFDKRLNIIKRLYQIEVKRLKNEIRIFSPQIFFRVRNDDLIIFANTGEYTIYLADGEGRVRKIIKNKYEPLKLLPTDRKREFEERYGGRTLPPELKFIFPDYYPPIEHLLLDDQDNIFVRTYERTKDGAHYYDYFDAEGRYIASFPMKETIFCIRGGRFYTLEEDEEGYQKIVRYRYRLKLK